MQEIDQHLLRIESQKSVYQIKSWPRENVDHQKDKKGKLGKVGFNLLYYTQGTYVSHFRWVLIEMFFKKSYQADNTMHQYAKYRHLKSDEFVEVISRCFNVQNILKFFKNFLKNSDHK